MKEEVTNQTTPATTTTTKTVEVFVNGSKAGDVPVKPGTTLGNFVTEQARKYGIRSFCVMSGGQMVKKDEGAKDVTEFSKIEINAKDSRGSFRAIVCTPISALYGLGKSNAAQAEFESLDEAKKGVDRLVANANYKGHVQAGYTAYVIDSDTDKIVAKAEVKPLSAEWVEMQ